MEKIRVGIADDNELSREMLRVITELDDSLEIVGEAENGIEAWALVKEEKPDILLLDVVMPRGDGLEVLAKARALFPGTKCILTLTAPLGRT